MLACPGAAQGFTLAPLIRTDEAAHEAVPKRGLLCQNPRNGAVMTRQQVLDLYFMDARAKLLDIAAFMDRIDRADGDEDFRMKSFRKTIALRNTKKNRAEKD